MTKTLVAQNVHRVSRIDFQVDTEGKLAAINVTGEVNYGTFGRDETVDALPLLSLTQRGNAQKIYDLAKAAFEKAIME